MKEHFCLAENTVIAYQDKCNWCGELEIQKRTWVGLTDDEQMALLKDSDGQTRHWLVWLVEAKLKEKNA